MDNYKLTYLNLRGIAEPIRLLFKFVNVQFEDHQIDVKTWYDVKKDFKWQQVPFLEYNGKVLTQSGAIGNFLARKFNLVPDDPWQQAKCEEIIGAAQDLRILAVKPIIIAKYEGKMELVQELKDQHWDTTIAVFLTNLNDILEELRKPNDTTATVSTDLILGGSKPTWADFCLATLTEMYTTGLDEPTLLDKYPLLKRQQKAVYSLPGVAEWIKIRPQTFI